MARSKWSKMQIQNFGIYGSLTYWYFSIISLQIYSQHIKRWSALQNAASLADGFRRKKYNLNLAVKKNSQIFLRQISTSFLFKNQYGNIKCSVQDSCSCAMCMFPKLLSTINQICIIRKCYVSLNFSFRPGSSDPYSWLRNRILAF